MTHFFLQLHLYKIALFSNYVGRFFAKHVHKKHCILSRNKKSAKNSNVGTVPSLKNGKMKLKHQNKLIRVKQDNVVQTQPNTGQKRAVIYKPS